MIESLASSAKRLVRNPALLLPGLAAIAILLLLSYAFAGFAIDLLLNAVFLEMVPDAGIQALPFQFLAVYGLQLLGLLIFALVTGVLFSSLNYWYAAYVRAGIEGKASIGSACRETISGLGKMASFVFFIAVLSFLFGIAFWLFALAALFVEVLGLILLALLALAGFYLYIKLAFTIQAMALEELTVKQALQQSWQFSQGRFWHILLLLLILGVVSQAISLAGNYASELVLDDLISIVILAVFWSIGLAFAGIAIPLYYAKKKLGKSI